MKNIKTGQFFRIKNDSRGPLNYIKIRDIDFGYVNIDSGRVHVIMSHEWDDVVLIEPIGVKDGKIVFRDVCIVPEVGQKYKHLDEGDVYMRIDNKNVSKSFLPEGCFPCVNEYGEILFTSINSADFIIVK